MPKNSRTKVIQMQDEGNSDAGLRKTIGALCPDFSVTQLVTSIMLLQKCQFRDGAGTRWGSLNSADMSSLLVQPLRDSTSKFSGGVTLLGGFTESQPRANVNVNLI
ncbi:hypothetical protein llap_14385 [Limosa lapponica baueri]|uniref:Uncharacterized protein n=1 Tax=Limosa lapponica baueri TaxID=1758121 RepID=A0A2I0TNB2_LIMLA|nr:hypothetical protein llap_14385 [Limosa lapponica baueri]